MTQTLKTAQVIMLPTDKNIKTKDLVKFPSGKLKVMSDNDMLDYLESESNATKSQHLYLVSDDEPKDDDWVMPNNLDNPFNRKPYQFQKSPCPLPYWGSAKTCKKIIATTDRDLIPCACKLGYKCDDRRCLPHIPQSFVEAYAKANGDIKEVHVEYEPEPIGGNNGSVYPITYQIKTRPDNTVIVHYSTAAVQSSEDERLETLKNILMRAGVRQHLNLNNSGYSQVERDIVDGLLGKFKYTEMDICRAYNAGKQNMLDVKNHGDGAFISSNDYIDYLKNESNKK